MKSIVIKDMVLVLAIDFTSIVNNPD